MKGQNMNTFYAKDYNVFKLSQSGQGGAMALAFSPIGLSLKIAKQIPGQRKFDWQSATFFYLDLPDIGALLTALRNKTKAELVHDASKFAGAKNPVMKGLMMQYNSQYNNYFWSLWRKEQGQTITASVPTSVEEAAIIQTLMAWALPRILQWDLVELKKEDSGTQETPSNDPLANVPDEIKNDPFWGMKEEIQPQQQQMPSGPVVTLTPAAKLAKILELGKQKFGAVSDDDAKIKIMEATNLPLLENKYDLILADLERR